MADYGPITSDQHSDFNVRCTPYLASDIDRHQLLFHIVGIQLHKTTSVELLSWARSICLADRPSGLAFLSLHLATWVMAAEMVVRGAIRLQVRMVQMPRMVTPQRHQIAIEISTLANRSSR